MKLDSGSSHYFEGIPYCFSCRFKQRTTKQASSGVFATPVYKLKTSKVETLSPGNTTFSYSLSAFATSSTTPAKSKLQALLGGTPACQSCQKPVYKVEEVKVQKYTWHKSCFTCGGHQASNSGCNRVLSSSNYEVIQDIPYCKSCFTRQSKDAIAKLTMTPTRKVTQAMEGKADKLLFNKTTVMEDASEREEVVIPKPVARGPNQENTNPFALNAGKTDARVIKTRITPKVSAQTNVESPNATTEKVVKSAATASGVVTAAVNSRSSTCRPSLSISTQNVPMLDLHSPIPSNQKIYYPIDDLLAELLAHPPDSPSSKAKLKTFRNSISEPSCPKCYGTVSRADEVSVYGVTWHRRCFCCAECDTLLRSDNFVEEDALLFCKSCHSEKGGSTGSSTLTQSNQAKRLSISSGVASAVSLQAGGQSQASSTGISTHSSGIRASGSRPVHQLQMITEESDQDNNATVAVDSQKGAAVDTSTPSFSTVLGSPVAMPYRVTKSFEKLSLESPSHGTTGADMRDRHSLSLGHNRTVRRFSLASNAVSESTPTKRSSVTSMTTTPTRGSITAYNSNASNLLGISPRKSVTASPRIPIVSARGQQSPRKTGAEFDFTFEDKEKTEFQYHLDSVVEDIEKEKAQEREYALLLSDLVTFTDISFNDVVYRGVHFSHTHDFDEKGVFYWLGSSGKTSFYRNPHTSGRITAKMSSCFAGDPFNIVARSADHCPNYTYNRAESWVEVDFGPHRLMLVDKYTVRHGSSTVGNALRSWKLQAKAGATASSVKPITTILSIGAADTLNQSGDDDQWVTLKEHEDDQSLAEEPNSTATWEVDMPTSIGSDFNSLGFRYFRLLQTDLNSSGNNCLFCCGVEFYGLLFEKVNHNED